MKTKEITISLKKARKWYTSGNYTLKSLALKAFSKEELEALPFRDITTFEDALEALGYTEDTKRYIRNTINDTSCYSAASAAMYKLNLIKKALNKGYDLGLTHNADSKSTLWYPSLRFIAEHKHLYNPNNCIEVGVFRNKGRKYIVIYNSALPCLSEGLGTYFPVQDIGYNYTAPAFLGCANREIAEHLGIHFGMLIIEAMYGDIPGFEIQRSFIHND